LYLQNRNDIVAYLLKSLKKSLKRANIQVYVAKDSYLSDKIEIFQQKPVAKFIFCLEKAKYLH